MNKFLKILLLSLFAVFLLSGMAMAATITYSNHDNETGAITALNSWLTANSFISPIILEDFESYPDQVPGSTPGETSYFSSGLNATFTATGAPGQGVMTFNTSEPKIGVIDRGTTNNGRTLNWDSPSFFDRQYLDSGDMTEITLNGTLAAQNYDSLFFFMFDVADVGGTMTLSEASGETETFSGLDNGTITFVGIVADPSEDIGQIAWSMNSDIDGFGLDNFGVGNPIPEPATLLFLGSGLLGLAVAGRKKFFKKS